MSVTELRKKGLTAASHVAAERLHSDLNAALDKAQDAGVTVEMIVGILELTKGAVFDAYFNQMHEFRGE